MKAVPLRSKNVDPDSLAVRRAARAVGAQITFWSSILVLGVLIAAFAFVFENVNPTFWANFASHRSTTIDVRATDILEAGSLIGVVAIVLAAIISVMATRRAVKPLASVLRAQRMFIADASHELRTPLTVLDARLQVLQRGLPSTDPSLVIVESLRRDTRALIDIVNELLAAAELDGSPSSIKESVRVTPAVERAVESMQPVADRKGVQLEVSSSDDLSVNLPAGALTRSVVALLDNALRYSPHGSRIWIHVTPVRRNVAIAVRDSGPGIQGVDPSRIFDRFVHSSIAVDGGGSTRTGFGIGLSLVDGFAKSVGGRTFVSSTSSAGTEIVLVLPRADR
jgi:two-component system OmpR family sensor kinase